MPDAYINDIPVVRTVDSEILRTIFQDKELTSYLFPKGFLVVVSWFFEPLVSNIKHIQKQRPYISISAALDRCIEQFNSTSNLEEQQLDSREKQSDNGPSGLLVICAHYETPTMVYCNTEVYGKPKRGLEDNELRSILFHSVKHATSLMEETKLPLALGISTDNDELLQVCKNIVAPLGFQHREMGAFKNHSFFEQQFEKLVN